MGMSVHMPSMGAKAEKTGPGGVGVVENLHSLSSSSASLGPVSTSIKQGTRLY